MGSGSNTYHEQDALMLVPVQYARSRSQDGGSLHDGSCTPLRAGVPGITIVAFAENGSR